MEALDLPPPRPTGQAVAVSSGTDEAFGQTESLMRNFPPSAARTRARAIRWNVICVAGAALLLWLPAGTAQAAGGACTTSAGTTTCRFASTGAEDSFFRSGWGQPPAPHRDWRCWCGVSK